MFVIITICLFSIQLLFANDPNSSDQSNEKTGTFITNFGGGLAFGGDTNLYVLLSELGVVKKLSDRYSFGYVFHSELDFADNNRFGFNLLLRRKLNNQKSYDVGIGFTIYQIGGREKSPTVTTFFNYNFLPDIAISTRLTIPRI
ncbi:MAG: hypothetical protein R3C41_12090 [Calditrichia bacterium]